jgi:hypothetical protein
MWVDASRALDAGSWVRLVRAPLSARGRPFWRGVGHNPASRVEHGSWLVANALKQWKFRRSARGPRIPSAGWPESLDRPIDSDGCPQFRHEGTGIGRRRSGVREGPAHGRRASTNSAGIARARCCALFPSAGAHPHDEVASVDRGFGNFQASCDAPPAASATLAMSTRSRRTRCPLRMLFPKTMFAAWHAGCAASRRHRG